MEAKRVKIGLNSEIYVNKEQIESIGIVEKKNKLLPTYHIVCNTNLGQRQLVSIGYQTYEEAETELLKDYNI